MKKILLLAATIALLSTAAVAQEKEFNLKVTPSEVNMIGEALGKLVTNAQALTQKLQTQINSQNEPVAAPAKEPEKGK